MPPRSKAAQAAAEEDSTDYTKYADKEPTDLQERFGLWILDKVGLEFGTKKEEASFLRGVTLATALRMKFQASPENQEVLADRRAAQAEDSDEDEPKPARKRPARKAKAEPEPDPEEVDEDEAEDDEDEAEEAPAPKRRTTRRTAAAKSSPAKTASKTTTRRRPAAKAKTGGDAPF